MFPIHSEGERNDHLLLPIAGDHEGKHPTLVAHRPAKNPNKEARIDLAAASIFGYSELACSSPFISSCSKEEVLLVP